jgi:predicted O-methyltransferase YrrM
VTDERWTEVDRFLAGLLVGPDPELDAALARAAASGLPAIELSPPQGKLLHLLARLCGSRTVLELGALGGYSTIWLARALPADGRLLSLELDPAYAAVASANVEQAGLSRLVEFRVGPALETLPSLVAEGEGPFDLVFIDADKENTRAYFESCLELSRAGTVIFVDNVVRGGTLVDPAGDSQVQGMREFVDYAGADPRVEVTAVQTVGTKGHDGFALAYVTSV